MERLVIQNGRLVDPSQELDRVGTILIEGGRIVGVVDGPCADGQVVDATDCIVTPGWIDIGAELREPGFEEDETIATGTAAAVAGGFTTLACLPNTDPPIDTQAAVEFVRHQALDAGQCHVVVLACVSKERRGEQMAELGILARAGAIGFTDCPTPIHNPDLLRRALQYCRMFQLPIFNRPEVRELSGDGIMHDGLVSTVLGLPGLPPAAEDVMTGRDLRIAEATGGRLHLMRISTAGSVDQIRKARERYDRVTASVSLPNLIATDEVMRSFNTNYKLQPPLRARHHVDACLEGLRDGTIDILTTGHTPRSKEKKMCELDHAPFGAIGLETAVPLIVTHLITPGHLDWSTVVDRVACQPARLLGLRSKGTLRVGMDADVTVIDPHAPSMVTTRNLRSKSQNSPWLGETMRGNVRAVAVAGRLVFVYEESGARP